MSCSVHSTVLPKPGRKVNGVQIPRDVIAREVQHHPRTQPGGIVEGGGAGLVVRELLLQEARRLESWRSHWTTVRAGVRPPKRRPSARSSIARSIRRRRIGRHASDTTRRTGNSSGRRISTRRPIFCSPPARPTRGLRAELMRRRSRACSIARSPRAVCRIGGGELCLFVGLAGRQSRSDHRGPDHAGVRAGLVRAGTGIDRAGAGGDALRVPHHPAGPQHEGRDFL